LWQHLSFSISQPALHRNRYAAKDAEFAGSHTTRPAAEYGGSSKKPVAERAELHHLVWERQTQDPMPSALAAKTGDVRCKLVGLNDQNKRS
jgi:hypothetical protein